MAYQKTVWKARAGENLDNYLKYDETDTSVVLVNSPDSLTEPGTELSPPNLNHMEDGIGAAHELIETEKQARIQGDANTLAGAKAYTDQAQLATQTWLQAVNQKSLLNQITGLNNKINYLCRVIADPNPANNGVYQAIAGWSGSPAWTYFSDNQDWVDETEMAAAIGAHNQSQSGTTHADIRAAIAALLVQIEALAPEGMENLPELFAKKQPKVVEATCATAAATVAKVVTLNGYALASGDILAITFTNGNTANSATINVNGSGAKQVRLGSGQPAGAGEASAGNVAAGNTVLYYYNGTYMCQLGSAGALGIPVAGTTADFPVAALPVYHYGASRVVNLNDAQYRKIGIHIIYNPASGSEGFPPNWGTGTGNAAILISLPWYSDTVVSHTIYKRGTNLEYKRNSTSASAWSAWEKSSGYDIGDLYIQWPNTKTPMEEFGGNWTKWHDRAEQYGLSMSRPTGYNTLFYEDRYDSLNGNNGATVNAVAAGDYRQIVYKDGDREVMRAKVAIAANAPHNPVEWEPLSENASSSYRPIFKWRSEVQTSWTAADLAIGGSVVISGTTYYVTERHNYGGKFISMTGGNRPAYDPANGIGRDAIRNFPGKVRYYGAEMAGNDTTGPFRKGAVWRNSRANTNSLQESELEFDPSLVVPTDIENKVCTMAGQPWRKTG
jgi:hypothetical protein